MAVVVLTGTSSGFGLHGALACARRGDSVFATMRNLGKAEALRDAAASEGLDVDVLELDVTKAATIDRCVAEVVARAGRIDALVNNAGTGQIGPLEEFSDDEVRAMFESNVFGAIRVTRAVLPLMRAQESGRIINVGSLAGIVPVPFMAVYAATKHALEALTDALAGEVSPWGIDVVALQPGAYPTPMMDIPQPKPAAHDESSPYRDRCTTLFDNHLAAMRTGGDPAEVGEAIADLVHADQPALRTILPARSAPIDDFRRQAPRAQFLETIRQSYGL